MVALSTLPDNTGEPRETPSGRPERPRVQYGIELGKRRITERERDQMVGRYLAGLSAIEVAEELGCAKSTVIRTLRCRGVEVRPQGIKYR